eukprot:scaffold44519_cov214-Amphora_coffeaeformis.AAC.5
MYSQTEQYCMVPHPIGDDKSTKIFPVLKNGIRSCSGSYLSTKGNIVVSIKKYNNEKIRITCLSINSSSSPSHFFNKRFLDQLPKKQQEGQAQ